MSGSGSERVVTLAEDILLLACHDVSGRSRLGTTELDLGLGGALLLDLDMRGRIGLADGHVVVTDPTPPGVRPLDDALAAIVGDPKPRYPDHWVRHLAHGARAAAEERLVVGGVWRRDDHRVLGVIPVHRAHQVDKRLEHVLLDRLHDAVVLGHAPTRETEAVVTLALAVGLDRCLFPRSDRRAVRQRMTEIAQDHWVAVAVHQAVDGVHAALGITESGAT